MPRKKKAAPDLTGEELAALDEFLRVLHAYEHLQQHLVGREAEVRRAQGMIGAALDGLPNSVQYAAILLMAKHCVRQMYRDPYGWPKD